MLAKLERAVVAAAIFGLACTAWSGVHAEEGNCILWQQLKDPLIRADYEAFLAATDVRSKSRSQDPEKMYGRVRKASHDSSSRLRPSRPVDLFSLECLYCHDGSTAKAMPTQDRGQDGSPLGNLNGGHSIGTDYEAHASQRYEDYRPMGTLHPDIMLIEGKVGCLSCHNPLSDDRNHLVMDNSRSILCLNCHVN